VTVRSYGASALLVDTSDPLGLAAASAGLDGVVDVVPGAGSLLVFGASEAAAAALRELLGALEPQPVDQSEGTVTIPVVYDGADLEAVGERTGLGAAEVRRRHSGGLYRVALMGFAPGFGYLSGLDPALQLPRRDEPRASVPSGAVAIAGEWTGCYPRSSPGGWHLLGRTDAELWSLDRDEPALLRPGLQVRFEDVT
jgi:KipI family sensor histidine kinase inhibitor